MKLHPMITANSFTSWIRKATKLSCGSPWIQCLMSTTGRRISPNMLTIAMRAAAVTLALSPVFLGFYYVQWGEHDFGDLVFFYLFAGLIPAMFFISIASLFVFYVEKLKLLFLNK